MRASIARLAQSISARPIPEVKAAVQSLLPPKVLYRRLLRAHHKHLPIEMRILGDDYVKAEFRRTQKTDNPLHIMGFLGEWKKYLDLLETGEGAKGKQIDRELLEKMSPEQIGQLYELMQAARGEMTDQQREDQIEHTLKDMGIPTGSTGSSTKRMRQCNSCETCRSDAIIRCFQ